MHSGGPGASAAVGARVRVARRRVDSRTRGGAAGDVRGALSRRAPRSFHATHNRKPLADTCAAGAARSAAHLAAWPPEVVLIDDKDGGVISPTREELCRVTPLCELALFATAESADEYSNRRMLRARLARLLIPAGGAWALEVLGALALMSYGFPDGGKTSHDATASASERSHDTVAREESDAALAGARFAVRLANGMWFDELLTWRELMTACERDKRTHATTTTTTTTTRAMCSWCSC